MKNAITTAIISATLVFAAVICFPVKSSLAADAGKGTEVYNTYCALCHGPMGHGDGVGAAALDPKPRDLSNAEFMQGYKDEYLEKVVAGGGASVGKSFAMPPWEGVLSPEDIKNVVAHIRQNLCKCQHKP